MGVCPMPIAIDVFCPENLPNRCENDQQCPGLLKCCRTFCNLMICQRKLYNIIIKLSLNCCYLQIISLFKLQFSLGHQVRSQTITKVMNKEYKWEYPFLL